MNEVGDVVRLRSGGAAMTVEGIEDSRPPCPPGLTSAVALRPELVRVRCVWWTDLLGGYHRDTFPATGLELVS